jgi:hypothetical protein
MSTDVSEVRAAAEDFELHTRRRENLEISQLCLKFHILVSRRTAGGARRTAARTVAQALT